MARGGAMTREDAEALAAKREKHKPKSMQHKRWEAVHTSTKGWHAALVDCPHVEATSAGRRALDALHRGDMGAFRDAAAEALIARCKAALAGTEVV